MAKHGYTAKSGVKVHSSVPVTDTRWWDHSALHIFWSYSSWATLVLSARGLKAPRKFFMKVMSR